MVQNDENNPINEEFKFSESYKRRKAEILKKKFGKIYKADESTPRKQDESCIMKQNKNHKKRGSIHRWGKR